MREYTDGESKFASLLQRAMDLDGVDRETLHHLVSLLMKVKIAVSSSNLVLRAEKKKLKKRVHP